MNDSERNHADREVSEAFKSAGFGATSGFFGLVAVETLASGRTVSGAVFGALAIAGATRAKFHWGNMQEHRAALAPVRAEQAMRRREEQVDAEILASSNGLYL